MTDTALREQLDDALDHECGLPTDERESILSAIWPLISAELARLQVTIDGMNDALDDSARGRLIADQLHAAELARLEQENERLKRHGKVDDLAFDSANRGLVEAEAALDAMTQQLARLQEYADAADANLAAMTQERDRWAARFHMAVDDANAEGDKLSALEQRVAAVREQMQAKRAAHFNCAKYPCELCKWLDELLSRLSEPPKEG